jgi:Kelch motif
LDRSTKKMSTAKLSRARHSVSSLVAGNKIFFAGGRDAVNHTLDVVDIFDLVTRTWSVQKLSVPRADMALVSFGTKVFFAGGDLGFGSASSRVDIYDLNTGQWTVTELPTAAIGIHPVTLGNELVFAGGVNILQSKAINQAVFMDPSSLSTRTECMVSEIPYGMVYDPGGKASVIGNNFYFQTRNLISRYHSTDKKWYLRPMERDLQLFGLHSYGTHLLGLGDSGDYDYVGYRRKIVIYVIEP